VVSMTMISPMVNLYYPECRRTHQEDMRPGGMGNDDAHPSGGDWVGIVARGGTADGPAYRC
jgi:hypothetical protein